MKPTMWSNCNHCCTEVGYGNEDMLYECVLGKKFDTYNRYITCYVCGNKIILESKIQRRKKCQ